MQISSLIVPHMGEETQDTIVVAQLDQDAPAVHANDVIHKIRNIESEGARLDKTGDNEALVAGDHSGHVTQLGIADRLGK